MRKYMDNLLWWEAGQDRDYKVPELRKVLGNLERKLKRNCKDLRQHPKYNCWEAVSGLIKQLESKRRHKENKDYCKLLNNCAWVIKTSNPFREALQLSQDSLRW